MLHVLYSTHLIPGPCFVWHIPFVTSGRYLTARVGGGYTTGSHNICQIKYGYWNTWGARTVKHLLGRGSHSDHEGSCLPGCDAVQFGRSLSKLCSNLLPYLYTYLATNYTALHRRGQQSPTVSICTTSCNIKKSDLCPCFVAVFLKTSSDRFSEENNWLVIIYNGHGVCSLWGCN
jgi:hypothetical protein